MRAAASPSSTGLRCVFLEISDSRCAAQLEGWSHAEDPGWLCLPPCWFVLPVPELARAFRCCVTGCLSGRAARPLRSGVMAGTHSLCWSFVLPGYAAVIFLGCHEQRGPCGDLVESLQEREQDLSQNSPLPLLDRKITNLSVTWTLCQVKG